MFLPKDSISIFFIYSSDDESTLPSLNDPDYLTAISIESSIPSLLTTEEEEEEELEEEEEEEEEDSTYVIDVPDDCSVASSITIDWIALECYPHIDGADKCKYF